MHKPCFWALGRCHARLGARPRDVRARRDGSCLSSCAPNSGRERSGAGYGDAQARTIAAAIVAATMNERAAFFLDDYAVLPYHAESLARLVIF